MLTAINPKLPMRDKSATKNFYLNQLGFRVFGRADYEGYLMLEKDQVQIHFFEFKNLNPAENYGQVYIRTNDIDALYRALQQNGTAIHPNGPLQIKPGGKRSFLFLTRTITCLPLGRQNNIGGLNFSYGKRYRKGKRACCPRGG